MKNIFLLLLFSFINFSIHSQSKHTIDELNKEALELLDKHKEKATSLLNNNEVEESYDIAYEKLMELYVAQQSSDSFIKADSLREKFIDKMNLDNEKHNEIIGNTKPIFEWAIENIDSTLFTNAEEATELYRLSLIENNKEYITNEEYYVYMLMAIQKYGGEMLGKLIVDYELNNPKSKVNKALYYRP